MLGLSKSFSDDFFSGKSDPIPGDCAAAAGQAYYIIMIFISCLLTQKNYYNEKRNVIIRFAGFDAIYPVQSGKYFTQQLGRSNSNS